MITGITKAEKYWHLRRSDYGSTLL